MQKKELQFCPHRFRRLQLAKVKDDISKSWGANFKAVPDFRFKFSIMQSETNVILYEK